MNRDSILDILYNNRSREFQGKWKTTRTHTCRKARK